MNASARRRAGRRLVSFIDLESRTCFSCSRALQTAVLVGDLVAGDLDDPVARGIVAERISHRARRDLGEIPVDTDGVPMPVTGEPVTHPRVVEELEDDPATLGGQVPVTVRLVG